MKRSTLFFAVFCICAVLALSTLGCAPQDNNGELAQLDADPAREKFVPSPIFSPVYPPLPHHFSDIPTYQILCKAPKGAFKRALAPPLEPTSDDSDLFILLLAWTPDVEKMGFNVHEIAINAPVKWNDQVGQTTLKAVDHVARVPSAVAAVADPRAQVVAQLRQIGLARAPKRMGRAGDVPLG